MTAAFLLAASAFVAACGGAAATTTPGAPTPTPAAATPAGGEPTPTAPDGAVPSIGAIPSFDLSQLASGLENHDSYKATLSIGGTPSYETTVVTKPVVSRDIKLKDGTPHRGRRRRGLGGPGRWAAPADARGARRPSCTPPSTRRSCSGASRVRAGPRARCDKGAEQKNGQDTHHYHIDSTTAATGFSRHPGRRVDRRVGRRRGLPRLAGGDGLRPGPRHRGHEHRRPGEQGREAQLTRVVR